MLNILNCSVLCFKTLTWLILINLLVKTFLTNIALTKNIEFSTNSLDQQQSPAKEIDRDYESKSTSIVELLKNCDPCPKNIKCVPKIQCPIHIQKNLNQYPQVCDLPVGKQNGFYCTTGQNHIVPKNIRNSRTAETSLPLDYIDESIVVDAKAKFANFLNKVEPNFYTARSGQLNSFHNIAFHSSMPNHLKIIQLSDNAIQQIFASQLFKERQSISNEDFFTNNIETSFHSTSLGDMCPVIPSCIPSSKYRTIDGSCNNPVLSRSLWGASGQPMERVLLPAYEDGVWEPRLHSVTGTFLTSARDISRILFSDVNRPHPKYNLLLMQFGQFIAHDLVQSSTIKLPNGNNIECCTQNGFENIPSNIRHFACMPISISPEDEFYSMFGQRCMNFVRLALAPNSDCSISYAKQINKVTHYLDGSQIYGSDIITARNLRLFRGGKLRMSDNFGRSLLPLVKDAGVCGSDQSTMERTCFQAGDGRINEIVSLTILHTIFAREHNRIASILSTFNPNFSDEFLYQEARRIVIAEYQHITYKEWLPLLIGSDTMKRFELEPHHHSYSNDYSSEVKAAITSEFAGAAFRFGHSAVDGLFRIRRHQIFEEQIQIPDVMFNPIRLQQDANFLNDLLRTLTEQPMQEADDSITQGLSKFLFRGTNVFGLDLAAINIQRGRDKALRSYNDYLELIGHKKIKSFNEFSPQIASKLSTVYQNPDDIDLWVGGLLEKSYHDSVVGPTFSEIIADQFSRLRRGDRYFYENSLEINPIGYFNHDQLQEIRKSTMARILCDNLDKNELNAMPPLAFLRSDMKENHPINCNSHAIPTVDLNAWKIKEF